jgi:hypothetical protein
MRYHLTKNSQVAQYAQQLLLKYLSITFLANKIGTKI